MSQKQKPLGERRSLKMPLSMLRRAVAVTSFGVLSGIVFAQAPAAPGTAAQEAAANQAEQTAPAFRTGVNVVSAPVTVADKDGNYIHGLRSTEFRLFDNEMVQRVNVDEVFAPISLVVAIQADAKMEAVLPKLQKIGTLLTNMVAGDGGEVAIIGFDHRINKVQDFTSNPDAITEALKKLKPGSSSSLLTDTVVEATRMLRNRPRDRRKVLLLIAESRDKGSSMPTREALTNLELANVMVYALNVSRLFTEFTASPPLPRPPSIPAAARPVPGGGAQTPTTVGQLKGDPGYGADFAPLLAEAFQAAKGVFVANPIEVFTRYSGGKEYPFVSQRDLDRVLSDLSGELHNQYVLTYTPTNLAEGGFHKIRVEVARRNVEVRTRDGYWIASQ